MFYRNWHALVYCDGRPLEEYHFRTESAHTVSCYIASEAGRKFTVEWRSLLQSMTFADCYMDGHRMGRTPTKPGRSGSCWGVRTSAHTKQPFQFASLVTTDDDSIANPDDMSVHKLGVIELRILRVEFLPYPRRGGFRAPDIPEPSPIHERSKKAGTHCVSLGDGVRFRPHQHTENFRAIDKPDRPHIRFIFRYRPKDVLQAQGIIPPGPSSGPDDEADSSRWIARRPSTDNSHQLGHGLLEGMRIAPVKHEGSSTVYNVDSDEDNLEVETLLLSGDIKRESTLGLVDLDADVIDLTMID